MFLRVLESSGVSARPVATFLFRIPYFFSCQMESRPSSKGQRRSFVCVWGVLYSTQTSASQETLPFAPGIDENLAVPW